VRRRDTRRQVGEERRDLGFDANSRIRLHHAQRVLAARLLHDIEPRPQIGCHLLDRGRHHIGHHARALAAAGNEHAERAGRVRIGFRGGRKHHRPYRIAGERRLGGERRRERHVRKAGGDRVHARAEHPVGAPHHGIGVMDHGRDTPERCGEHRRQRRIAAETDHRNRPDAAQQAQRLDGPDTQGHDGSRQRNRIASADRGARDQVDLARRKIPPVARRAFIGRKIDRDTAPPQRLRQGIGGKQMSAGPAGREQDERCCALAHQAGFHSGGNRSVGSRIATRGRSRVSASSMPMP
jgi:hypothetical protein